MAEVVATTAEVVVEAAAPPMRVSMARQAVEAAADRPTLSRAQPKFSCRKVGATRLVTASSFLVGSEDQSAASARIGLAVE